MSPLRVYSPSEIEEFIQKLAVYHEKRGTQLDPDPKVGHRHINLLQLYDTVRGYGGYDRVSDEKNAWRKVGIDLGLNPNANPTLSFQLKTVFYKNLAAYEISTVHNQEPPPREILEDITAKGGSLLTRTMDNWQPSARKEQSASNDHQEASGDDGTPSRERIESEEAPGSGGRATRSLRQAPPQRILFQPDSSSSRMTRNISANSHTSTPQHNHQQQQSQSRGASTSFNPSGSMENISAAVTNYEPRPQHALTLRPVITPGNNPTEFKRREQFAKAQAAGKTAPSRNAGILLPGNGFDGPNIYVRCLCALRSGVPSEQNYALHHLVKISMERGDKFRFEGFAGLAEALVDKILEVGSLFYQVEWEVAYMEEGLTSSNVLDGINGTPDILQRIAQLTKLAVDDNIQTADFADRMTMINEAALTLRNMVMLEDNAYYVADLAPLRDAISIVLNLPVSESVVELKHNMLDVAEQLTKYLALDKTDPMYISLLDQVSGDDRGAILTSLRAISRISMLLDQNNLLMGVPAPIVQNIINWTLLADEELAHACLDFLYQYTAVVENVDFLLAEMNVEPLVNQLTRLLGHGGRIVEKEYVLEREQRLPAPNNIAPIPQDLIQKLLNLDEPERSSHWLRCLFEEDQDESITQIALWQAYQACFSNWVAQTGKPLLAASEFIKNVSSTFADKAAAQVQAGPVQKFIIKGIRMRSAPVGLTGEEAIRCAWSPPSEMPCQEYFIAPEQLFQHILSTHLGAQKSESGQFENSKNQHFQCYWNGCHRFQQVPASSTYEVAAHVKIHLHPKREKDNSLSSSKRVKPSYMIAPKKMIFSYQVTATDERNDAAGIPLSAVLVLRNLARNVSKTDSEEAALKVDGGVSWVDRLFKPIEPRLFEVMTHNKALTPYLADLLSSVRDA